MTVPLPWQSHFRNNIRIFDYEEIIWNKTTYTIIKTMCMTFRLKRKNKSSWQYQAQSSLSPFPSHYLLAHQASAKISHPLSTCPALSSLPLSQCPPSGTATSHPPIFKYYPSFNLRAKCHFLEFCPYHSRRSKSFFLFCISVTCILIATEVRLHFFSHLSVTLT